MTTVVSCYIDGGEALSLSAVVARASLLYFRACPSTYFKGKFTVKQSCSGSRVMALMFIMVFLPISFSLILNLILCGFVHHGPRSYSYTLYILQS